MKIHRPILTLVLCLVLGSAPRAQSPLYFGGMRPGSGLFSRPVFFGHRAGDSSAWQLYPYTAFSAGFGFFNGASISAYSLPAGLQLAHPLNDRLTAFAGISIAPTVYSFNQNFMAQSGISGWPNAGNNNYNFNVNPRFEMGLQYTNADRTFSISGSIGVERSSNLYYPVQPRTGNEKRR